MASIGFLGALEGAADAGLGILKQKQDAMAEEKKAAMLEKLQQQREERAEAYKIAAEQREAATNAAKVTTTRMVERDGKMVQESVNDRGDVIKSEEADPYTVKKANLATRKDEVTIEGLLADSQWKTTRAAYADDIAEAGIQRNLAAAGKYDADAAKARDWSPGGGQPTAPVKTTAPKTTEVKTYFGEKDEDGKVSVNVDKLNEFNAWQQEQAAVDPRYNNGSFALSQYGTGNIATSTINVNGVDVLKPASISADAIAAGAAVVADRKAEGLETDKKSLGKFLTDYTKSGGAPTQYNEQPAAKAGTKTKDDYAKLFTTLTKAVANGDTSKEAAVEGLRKRGLNSLADRLEKYLKDN